MEQKRIKKYIRKSRHTTFCYDILPGLSAEQIMHILIRYKYICSIMDSTKINDRQYKIPKNITYGQFDRMSHEKNSMYFKIDKLYRIELHEEEECT